MRIISIANQKGGCGKTTTAINLSACLAHKGRNALLVDMDPQGHSGIGLNIDADNLEKSIFNVICDSEDNNVPINEVIIQISDKFHLAPSNISLSLFDQHLSQVNGRENKLKEAIADLHRIYDYLIIDCPPNLGLLTFNSLIASTEVIVPMEMSLFSLHGISKLYEIIELVHKKTGHEIQVKVVATMFDKRTRLSYEVLKNIKTHFNNSLFKTVINNNVTLKEAASFGKSIVDYQQKASGFSDYMALANEVFAEEKKLKMTPVKEKYSHAAAKVAKQFVFHAPEANTVKIVGNFNNWDPTEAAVMKRTQDGTWQKSLFLVPGTYEYRFIVDDTWVEDDNASLVDNSFGSKNSVVEIS